MSYANWKGKDKWKVVSLGTDPANPNPWGLSIGEFLTFNGDGNGNGGDDTIARSSVTTLAASDCLYSPPPLDTVVVTHSSGYTKITLTGSGPFTLMCTRPRSGGAAWTATGGG